MPYEVHKVEGSEDYEVINSETKAVKATHKPPDAEQKAKDQVELLHEVEKDPEWDKEYE